MRVGIIGPGRRLLEIPSIPKGPNAPNVFVPEPQSEHQASSPRQGVDLVQVLEPRGEEYQPTKFRRDRSVCSISIQEQQIATPKVGLLLAQVEDGAVLVRCNICPIDVGHEGVVIWVHLLRPHQRRPLDLPKNRTH
eukprot:CAMPEP_0206500762 /NCGR_PEP_ID=MMETSP0324_2-20121206/52842_1 /ASSEMBLY_ACC=CAM_ASM_000836 /TAXON_ID=2866 /ORGANISM="Crypthecodinium cohnii, Strain Seligo" /LENGTH=135 /DNA_ID=CAMNT_0053988321 /DNA_START=51 /DNA_END=458 /DNA_ORIENTATION=+